MEHYERETDSVEVRKESVVERELNILAKAISELCRQAEQLENRLQVVLRAQPSSKDASGVPEEPLTVIPTEIRNQRQNIDRANYTLKSILSRLEI